VTLLYRALQSTLGYDREYGNSAHVGDGYRQNFAFKIAVKPLQINIVAIDSL